MSDSQETKCMVTAFLALRHHRNADSHQNTDVREKSTQHEKQEITLPDAIIRHVILSYRPCRSFRVVLIRGENTEIHTNNHFRGGSPNPTKREYSLTFGTNRGNLRFQVVELPYLPPRNKTLDAETYRGADGVVISCYMARFFEFCDRYGYDYASSSILEDIKVRQEPSGWQQSEKNRFPRCIILCGNNVDITHVDAKLPSIVFWEESDPSTSAASERNALPTSRIETPRHPFASLARSLTNDQGLEFQDASSFGSSKESYQFSLSKEQENCWNHDETGDWSWLRAHVS